MPHIHTFSDSVLAKASFNTAITAASVKGAGVNTFGYRRIAAIFDSYPTGANTTSDCKLQESVDDVDGHYADVTNATFTQSTTVLGHTIQILNIDPAKRKLWLRLVQTGVGASAAGVATGLFLLTETNEAAPTQDVAAVSI